uniref:Uncharacterized protein n=1 Tax=Rhizophora mucronata TaxID=61149 RepID=A0A2P2N8T8_RHIMU
MGNRSHANHNTARKHASTAKRFKDIQNNFINNSLCTTRYDLT